MNPWICPKCDRVWGPTVTECKPCNDRIMPSPHVARAPLGWWPRGTPMRLDPCTGGWVPEIPTANPGVVYVVPSTCDTPPSPFTIMLTDGHSGRRV